MAVKDAAAALTNSTELFAVTGYVPIRQAQIDETSGTIRSLTVNRWDSAASWSEFSNYSGQSLPLIWTSDPQDIGEVRYFTLDIQTNINGIVNFYDIFVSETGLFVGEETVTRVTEGDLSVPAFYGRYYIVQLHGTGTEILSMDMTASSETKSIRIPNLDTSTLSGTNTARQLPISYPVSAILDIDIKARIPTAYAVNLYVSDTATSQVLIPMVVSKSNTTPTIRLYGIDNDPRDGVVDVTITALPRQVMFGGNLTVIF